MYKKILITILTIIFINKNYSQDLVFSQYYSAQPYINPALTGFFDGNYRINVNYRNQWSSIGTGNNAYGVSADALLLKKDEESDYVGVGINMYRDENGFLANNFGKLNFSYNKKLGLETTHILSIGTGLGINNESISLKNPIFPDDNTENLERKSIYNFDLALGVNYQAVFSEHINFFAGVSVDHLLPINNSFYNLNFEKSKRISIYSASKFAISQKTSIIPTALIAFQGVHNQINIGNSFQFKLRDYLFNRSSISFGTFARFGNNALDALIATTKIELHGYSFGLSYDLNVNELSKATNGLGSFELSLGYIGFITKIFQSRADCPNTKNF